MCCATKARSTRATNPPLQSDTAYWGMGRRPASTRVTRRRDSCGDSARPSASPAADRARRAPGTALSWWAASTSAFEVTRLRATAVVHRLSSSVQGCRVNPELAAKNGSPDLLAREPSPPWPNGTGRARSSHRRATFCPWHFPSGRSPSPRRHRSASEPPARRTSPRSASPWTTSSRASRGRTTRGSRRSPGCAAGRS